MLSVMEIAFWGCMAIIAYVYFGYPLLLATSLLRRRKPILRSPLVTRVSIIVPAHNEEKTIATKLHNLCAIRFPREQFEILVGNDGSSDQTEAVLRRCLPLGIKIISSAIQEGKSTIQNKLVEQASGDVLVFTDADCTFDPEALGLLLENFADPTVGLVTARPRYLNSADTSITENESVYLRYESWIRRQESDQGLLSVASGSLFAMRRALWRPLARDVGDDFVLPLQVAMQGFRNVLDDRFFADTVLTQSSLKTMFRLKTRIISKDLLGLLRHAAVLNPLRMGSIALAVWSHKLVRWAVPLFLLLALAANLFLLATPLYQVTMALQFLFYALAAGGLLGMRRTRLPFSVPLSFCLVNAAALVGIFQCATLGPDGKWKPAR